MSVLLAILMLPLAAHAAGGEEGDLCQSDAQCDPGLGCGMGIGIGLGLCGTVTPGVPPRVNHRLCNSDPDCPRNQQCRMLGVCSTGDCAFSCPPMHVCRFPDGCVQVECTTDSHCGGGVCIGNECMDCRGDGDCPDRHLCRSNQCREVECTRQQHCRNDQQCLAYSCRDRCDASSRWVVAPGLPVCGACVPRQGTTLACTGPGDCAIDRVCAEGSCIPSCNGLRNDVQALRREIARLDEIQIELTGPPRPGDPCLSCPRSFATADLRAMLRRAGVPQQVAVQLVDQRGSLVADLGSHAPQGGTFATLGSTVTATPRAALDLDRGRCNYRLVVTNDRGETLAQQTVCMTGS